MKMDAVVLGIKRNMDAVVYPRRQGLKQDTTVQLQVMNNSIKSNFI